MLNAIRLRHIPIAWLYLALAAALLLVMVSAVAFGPVSLKASQIMGLWFDQLTGQPLEAAAQRVELIINQIRLPRALMALLVGALLAISGAATQGLFRNPLADPSLIGVTSGASVGASLVIVLGGTWVSSLWGVSLISLGAFTGGCLSVWLVYRLASSSMGTSVSTMLLAGIGITAMAAGITSLFEFYADNEMLRRISLWRMGGLDGANYERLLCLVLVAVVVMSLLPRYSQALNAFLLGESEARHLGIEVDKVKRSIVLLVAAAVGISVALTGVIAFIGLVVPHVMRMIAGPDHRHLLPLSALAGGLLLLLADLVARTLIAPVELPVGLVTSLIGAPFFISLLRRRHQYGMQSG